MPTFPEWEAATLEETYEYVDYISLHNYYGNPENDTEDFFAKTQDLEHLPWAFLHLFVVALHCMEPYIPFIKTQIQGFLAALFCFYIVAGSDDSMDETLL